MCYISWTYDGSEVGHLNGARVGNADNKPDPGCSHKVFTVLTQVLLPNTS